MNLRWKFTIGAQVVGLLLLTLVPTTEPADASTLFAPLALFLGTMVPATLVASSQLYRFLPTPSARVVSILLAVVLLVVILSLGLLHSVAEAESLLLYATVSIAVWGMIGLGLVLTIINTVTSAVMARNYARVRSGRPQAINMIMIGLGAVALTAPLLVLDMTQHWPYVADPGLLLLGLGQQRLERPSK
ncbi:MAG: hypothetical protein ACO3I4_07035 [Candidatus Kapaibacteriota bacterium]